MVGKLFSNHKNDIILAPTPRAPRSKKPLLFAAGAAVLVAALVALVVLMPKNQSAPSSANIQSKRNLFVNFCLFGTASDQPVTADYDSNTAYKIEIAIENRDRDFINKANDYYTQFIDIYEKASEAHQDNHSKNDQPAYYNDIVESVRDTFSFFKLYSDTDILSEDDIVNRYLEHGADSTHAFINTNYKPLLESSYVAGSKYAEEKVAYDTAQVDMLSIYNISGCISGRTIKEDCNLKTKDYDIEKISQALGTKGQLKNFINTAVANLAEQLFGLAKEEL